MVNSFNSRLCLSSNATVKLRRILTGLVLSPPQVCMQHLLNITKSLEKIERLLKGSASQEPAVNEPERYGQSSGVCVCGV